MTRHPIHPSWLPHGAKSISRAFWLEKVSTPRSFWPSSALGVFVACPRRCFATRRWGLGARRPGQPSCCAAGREVLPVELRIWPWALSRFVASLKAGPFLLILLIKHICFVRQNRLFIKTEHNFMGFLRLCKNSHFPNMSPKAELGSVCACVQGFTKPQIFSCQIPPSESAQHLAAPSQSSGLILIAWEAMGVFNLLKK